MKFAPAQFTAGKASTVLRRQNIAYTDLQQIGQEAKVTKFALQCKTVPQYMSRVKEERKRVITGDNKRNRERDVASMHKELRWRTELLDAFEWIAVTSTPVVFQGGAKKLIGRMGFLKLIQYGKLLGVSRAVANEYFKSVDPAAACFVPFDSVWTWFLRHAQEYETTKLLPAGRVLKFTLVDILSAEERAVITTLKRVNSEKVEFTSSLDWDALEEKRRKAAEDASSSEEEEEEEDIDEDTLFSDPRYLQNADIGRLMKYLTKRKQMREREAREAAFKAEALAKVVAAQKAVDDARNAAAMAAILGPFPTSSGAGSGAGSSGAEAGVTANVVIDSAVSTGGGGGANVDSNEGRINKEDGGNDNDAIG